MGEYLFNAIRRWALERNLLKGTDFETQFLEAMSSYGKLANRVTSNDLAGIKKEIGGILFRLACAFAVRNTKLEDYTGRRVDWYVSPADVPDHKEGDKLSPIFKEHLRSLLLDLSTFQQLHLSKSATKNGQVRSLECVIFDLQDIALCGGWSLRDCLVEAYEETKEVKGLFYGGKYIAEVDFTVEKIENLLKNIETLPEEAENYLNNWLTGERTQTIEVVLGVFNKPNVFGVVYVASPIDIIAGCKNLVGKHVGELSKPNIALRLESIEMVCPSNSAGELLGFNIDEEVFESNRVTYTVRGVVKPSPTLIRLIKDGATPFFGIRSLVEPFAPESKERVVKKLICFDLCLENPHPTPVVDLKLDPLLKAEKIVAWDKFQN